MLHKEDCGFLTAGIMNLGLAAGRLKIERKEAKEWNKQKVNEYWAWWISQAPLRCYPQGRDRPRDLPAARAAGCGQNRSADLVRSEIIRIRIPGRLP
jgi:hypothetical protein